MNEKEQVNKMNKIQENYHRFALEYYNENGHFVSEPLIATKEQIERVKLANGATRIVDLDYKGEYVQGDDTYLDDNYPVFPVIDNLIVKEHLVLDDNISKTTIEMDIRDYHVEMTRRWHEDLGNAYTFEWSINNERKHKFREIVEDWEKDNWAYHFVDYLVKQFAVSPVEFVIKLKEQQKALEEAGDEPSSVTCELCAERITGEWLDGIKLEDFEIVE